MLRARIYKLEDQVVRKQNQLQLQDTEVEALERRLAKVTGERVRRKGARILSSSTNGSIRKNSPTRSQSGRQRSSVQEIRREARSESETLESEEAQ